MLTRSRDGPNSSYRLVLQVSVDKLATALAVRESIGEIVAIRGGRPVSADELAVGVAALTRGSSRSSSATSTPPAKILAASISASSLSSLLIAFKRPGFGGLVIRRLGDLPAEITSSPNHPITKS